MDRRLRFGRLALLGALVGLLWTVPLVVVLWLGDRVAGLSFPPFDLFDRVTGALPGAVVTFGIDSMISLLRGIGLNVADTAKLAERSMAIGQFVVGGAVVGALVFAFFGRRLARQRDASAGGSWGGPWIVVGLVVGALAGLAPTWASLTAGGATAGPWLSGLWLAVLFLDWGMALTWSVRRTVPSGVATATEGVGAVGGEELVAVPIDRRRFLVRVGALSASVTVAGAAVATLLARTTRSGGGAAAVRRTETGKGTPFPNLGDPVKPAPGTRPEYTPVADHYEVYIHAQPPTVDGATWVLPVTGMVERPLRLTLDEIRSRYAVHDRFNTISCISGRVGTSLISTTQWTGALLTDVLDDAGVQDGATYLNITSADGYHETVPLDLVREDGRLLLCYEWDGSPLPVGHGFPLRIWIPNRYGMKQPKWITGIEVTDQYHAGYWVERGWDRYALVKETSVVDTVAVDAAYRDGGRTLVPVGGIAWAGDRGISKVEVRVDGGAWQAARLRAPLSDTTWVIWRYDWPMEEGEHRFEVRCVDGSGKPQIEETHGNRPSGATGIDELTAKV